MCCVFPPTPIKAEWPFVLSEAGRALRYDSCWSWDTGNLSYEKDKLKHLEGDRGSPMEGKIPRLPVVSDGLNDQPCLYQEEMTMTEQKKSSFSNINSTV